MNGDLISRSALLEKLVTVVEYDEGGWGFEYKAVTGGDVLKAPAVDAVEVIHCKDCFYWMKAKVNRSGNLVCPKSGMEITAADFCSKADKRKCHYEK